MGHQPPQFEPKDARNIVWVIVGIIGLLLGAGCGSSDPVPCQPFDAVVESVKLGSIIAAGKHTDGTYYVVTRADQGAETVFKSEGEALWVQLVDGSGSGSLPGGDRWMVYTVRDLFTLKVEVSAAGAARMGVVRGTFEGRDFVIGEQGDVLEVVGGDAVGGMPARRKVVNVVEYLATLTDVRRLVVLRPVDWGGYVDHMHLFFGPPDRMVERKIRSFERQRDGGTTIIAFDLDGKAASAFFPSPLRMNGEPSLTIGSEILPMQLAEKGTPTDGLAFLCL